MSTIIGFGTTFSEQRSGIGWASLLAGLLSMSCRGSAGISPDAGGATTTGGISSNGGMSSGGVSTGGLTIGGNGVGGATTRPAGGTTASTGGSTAAMGGTSGTVAGGASTGGSSSVAGGVGGVGPDLNLPPATCTRTFYVSPTGSDSRTGRSPAEAWHFDAANSLDMEPGDCVLFEGGQKHVGALQLGEDDSGTAANPLTIGSYGTGRAILSSPDGLRAINSFRQGGVVIRDLIIEGPGSSTSTSDAISFWADRVGNRYGPVQIDNVEVRGLKRGILMGGSGAGAGYVGVRFTRIVVHDVLSFGLYTYGSESPGVYAHKDVYVAGCETYDIKGDPAQAASGSGIMIADVDTALIEYNYAHDSGPTDRGDVGPTAIAVYTSTGAVVQFNEAHHICYRAAGIDSGGFALACGSSNSVMQYNYAHDNGGYGFLVDGGCDKGTSGNTVRYNLAVNTYPGNGSLVVWNTAVGGTTNLRVYNNTFVKTEIDGELMAITTPLQGLLLANNILVSTKTGYMIWTDKSSDWKVVGNLYYGGGATPYALVGSTRYDVASWSASGQEVLDGKPTATVGDPRFLKLAPFGTVGDPRLLATVTNFQIAADSPAVDHGIDLAKAFAVDSGTHDYYGRPIPNGLPDIGIHER